MKPTVTDLIAALPDTLRGSVTSSSELQELLAVLARSPPPTSRALRLWSLGSLQARPTRRSAAAPRRASSEAARTFV